MDGTYLIMCSLMPTLSLRPISNFTFPIWWLPQSVTSLASPWKSSDLKNSLKNLKTKQNFFLICKTIYYLFIAKNFHKLTLVFSMQITIYTSVAWVHTFQKSKTWQMSFYCKTDLKKILLFDVSSIKSNIMTNH